MRSIFIVVVVSIVWLYSVIGGARAAVINTTTSVESSLNPSVTGQSVTFTAVVSGESPASGTPTGTVVFTDGTTGDGLGAVTLSDGVASVTASLDASTPSHTILAQYEGATGIDGSTGQVLQLVDMGNTSTVLAPSTFNAVYGQTVTFTASVGANSPAMGVPTGSVKFADSTTGTTLGNGTLNGSGEASLSTSAIGVTTGDVITATYGGDSNFESSEGSCNEAVSKANTTTSIAPNPNPSVSGQSVTYTATVSASEPSSAVPSGSVTFEDATTDVNLGVSSVGSNGQATVTSSAVATTAGDSITATYSGGADFEASSGSTVQEVEIGTYLLWTNSDMASLWKVGSMGESNTTSYGPISGWQAVGVASDFSGNAYLMWNHTADGEVSVFQISPGLSQTGYTTFGPYGGWTAQSIAAGASGNYDILWNHTADNEASIFDVTSGGNVTYQTYGPIAGWAPSRSRWDLPVKKYALWDSTGSAGSAVVWNIASDGSVTYQAFGPYGGWTATGLAVDSSGNPYVLWTTSGSSEVSVFQLTASLTLTQYQTFGPYSGWTATGFEADSPANVHVLWNHTSDNQASLFNASLGSSVSYELFGPISSWQTVDLASGN